MPNSRHPKLLGEDLQHAIIEASRCVASRRHMLEPIQAPPNTPRPQFGSIFVQRCFVCGTLAYDHVSRIDGRRIGQRTYDKPVWYQAALDERHDGDWWRATYWDTLGKDFFLDAEPASKVTPIKQRRRRAS
jgi:hypothetical protein